MLTPTGMLIPNGGSFANRWFASAGRLMRATVLFRFGGQRLGRFLVSMNHEDLVVLKDLIEAGKLTPVLDRTYPLSEAAQAMVHVGDRACSGKGRDHRVTCRPDVPIKSTYARAADLDREETT